MKKAAITLTLFIYCMILLLCTSCKNNEKTPTNLFSDNGYIDYAKEVYFDKEENPDLAEIGLFWTRWDEQSQSIIQVPADSEEGAALIDSNKPTIINVHGVLVDGYKKQEKFYLNKKVANPAEFDLNTTDVSMIYLWLRAGWNVGNFHYNRFVAELDPATIEYKIWTAKSEHGMYYRHPNKKKSANDISNYCLAEHFAADYIRAMQLLPEKMGQKEIRIVSHSMGGQLSTATLLLLTELSKHGQLPQAQLPSRLALLDAYFSTTLTIGEKVIYAGPKEAVINWSNKPLVKNHTGLTMLECLKHITNANIAIEYYTYQNIISGAMQDLVPELIKYSSYTMLIPDFQGGGFTLLSDGHNGVREWYLCSLLDSPVKDISDECTTCFGPSASLPTKDLFALKNKQFLQVSGFNTVRVNDDTLALMYNIIYHTNGGICSTNPSFFNQYTTDLVLLPPTKKDSTFVGWYDNPKFEGNKITVIDINKKQDIHLYAKWQ